MTNAEKFGSTEDIYTGGEKASIQERIADKVSFLKEIVGVTPVPSETEHLALQSNESLSQQRLALEEKLGDLHVDLDYIEGGDFMNDKLKETRGLDLFSLGMSIPSLGIALTAASQGNLAGAGVGTALTVGLMGAPVLNRMFAKGAEIKERMTKQVESSRTQRDMHAIDSVEQTRV